MVLFIFSPSAQVIVDQLGANYIQKQDNFWSSLSENPSQQNWDQFESIGNISRHHRYAHSKSILWQGILKNKKAVQQDIDQSMKSWAKKNKRDIKIQLLLVDYYEALEKEGKSRKIINRLTNTLPNNKLLNKYLPSSPEGKMFSSLHEYMNKI